MYKFEAKEAVPILERSLNALLVNTPQKGEFGSQLRTAVGDIILNAEELLMEDKLGEPLDNVFSLARQCEVSIIQIDRVRMATLTETPTTIGAIMIKNSIIHIVLATEARILANTHFVSRDDVDKIKIDMNDRFSQMEDVAADSMDLIYITLVQLHAAVSQFLIETARPLPRIVKYRFASVYSSLIVAHKLYYDASRADELRVENKIVHPAFMKIEGRALSA
jgi:prophage DNA circulation protein